MQRNSDSNISCKSYKSRITQCRKFSSNTIYFLLLPPICAIQFSCKKLLKKMRKLTIYQKSCPSFYLQKSSTKFSVEQHPDRVKALAFVPTTMWQSSTTKDEAYIHNKVLKSPVKHKHMITCCYCFIPPRKVLGFGTLPVNCACEKSKPGCCTSKTCT